MDRDRVTSVGTGELLNSVLHTLRSEEASLRESGLLHAFVFGSVARREEHPKSDIDIAAEFAPEVGSPQVFDLEERLTKVFCRPVHIVSRRGLRPDRHAEILRDLVKAF